MPHCGREVKSAKARDRAAREKKDSPVQKVKKPDPETHRKNWAKHIAKLRHKAEIAKAGGDKGMFEKQLQAALDTGLVVKAKKNKNKAKDKKSRKAGVKKSIRTAPPQSVVMKKVTVKAISR